MKCAPGLINMRSMRPSESEVEIRIATDRS
jgi:hypothetical protein